MGAIKQAMLIGSEDNSIITTEAYEMNAEFDIEALGGGVTFKLPYLTPNQKNVSDSGVDITRLEKFDTVKIFFGEFEEDFNIQAQSEADLIGLGLTQIFDGFIDTIKLNKTKTAFDYAITALSKVIISKERTLEFQRTDYGSATSAVGTILQISNLINRTDPLTGSKTDLNGNPIPDLVEFVSEIPDDRLPINLEGGKTTKDFLMKLREKYAVILHEAGDGVFRLSTAEIFSGNTAVDFEFDFSEGNIFDLDYGDLTSQYNAVVVFGFPPNVGVALDAIAVANTGAVNYFLMENRDLKSIEDCEQVARNKLLELERNFYITFKAPFKPEFRIGQTFRLKDQDRFTGDEKFIISKVAWTINKTDVAATITGYTHSLTLLPENIVLSNTGVADIDILELRSKLPDATSWNDNLST